MMLEIIVLMGTFLLLIVIGALSALSESFSQKRESKWAFSSTMNSEKSTRTIQPVDEASNYGIRTTIVEKSESESLNVNDGNTINYQKQIVNNKVLEEFTHSQINEEVSNNLNTIANGIDQIVNNYTDNCNDSQLGNNVKNKIKELVGEKTAGLVTNLITDLKENELSIIMGLYEAENHSLSFEGNNIKLSTAKQIISGKDDYILVKGTLLPNGEFRVIHFDDAETVEHGYGLESFVLEKTA